MDILLCTVTDELTEVVTKFRFRQEKTLGALLVKVNSDKMLIELEEEWKDTTIEEIANKIPPQEPRYVILNYPLKHDDGRAVSYPLLFVFIIAQGCDSQLQMNYAGSKIFFRDKSGCPQYTEFQSLEDFTDENIQTFLKKD